MAFDFNAGYDRGKFINFLRTDLFGSSFTQDLIFIKPERKTAFFVESGIFKIGTIQLGEEEISVLEIKQTSKNDPRVTLTQDAFKIMADLGIDNAIISLYVDNDSSWRFSLLTTKYEDFKKSTSNPKRFSFILGPNEKTRTVNQQLIKKGQIKDFEDLVSRFDVEVVRKEFFETYLELFVRLYKEILNDKPFVELLTSQSVDLVSFTKNLLGKIIFLYFIQQKGWLGLGKNSTLKYGEGSKDFMRKLWNNFRNQGESLCTHEKTGYFYNDYLEWLFFAGLNVDRRKDGDWFEQLQMKVPYLNGGLFKEEYDKWQTNIARINNDIFSNVEKKGDDADGILDIFDRYNFTVDEDSLYDTDIAVDPEMLGRIFEKMISISSDNIKDVVEIYDNKKKNSKFDFGKDLNKKLGAFYTPREIVHYMTRESLISFLQNKTNISEENIKILFDLKEKFLLNSTDMKKAEYSTEKLMEVGNCIVDIDEALKAVKILDPAVGSGAFPMGLLHEISSLRYYMYKVFDRILKDKLDKYVDKDGAISLYKIKKDIILNNIHGIDIDPGAIDIAKLRFWLSLVVDEQEPEPLPNFEFKFICADSLIPLEEGSLFTKAELIEELKNLRDEYYKCDDKEEKEKLRGDFFNIKNSLTGFGSLKDVDKKSKELLYKQNIDGRNKQISEWNPFETKKYCKWSDTELMMGQDKFDIVIGNPPYINTNKIDKAVKEVYKNLYKTAKSHFDIYLFFYERAFSFLNEHGILSFITSNKWMTQKYGEELRKIFLENKILRVIDFDSFKVFDSATVDCNIIIISKEEKSVDYDFYFLGFNKGDTIKKLLSDFKSVNTSLIKRNSGIFKLNINEDYIGIKSTIENGSNYLENYFTILYGMVVHPADNSKKKSDFIFDDNAGGLYKLYTEGKFIDKRVIKKTLYLNYDENVHREPRSRACFETPKILCHRLAGRNGLKFLLDDNNIYVDNTLHLIIPKNDNVELKYILGILNSKLITWYFGKFLSTNLDVYPAHLKKMPIKFGDKNLQDEVVELVNNILLRKKSDIDSDVTDLESKINNTVYKIYGLTDREINIIEENL